jgi:hypothetical protein
MPFQLAFQIFPLPIEAGCKGTVALFGFASGSKNKFFRGF